MKFPFKRCQGETILRKEGKWYLTFLKEKDTGKNAAAVLHACKDAVKYDKGLDKGHATPDMDEGCPFCNEDIPDVLAVTQKLINDE